MVSLGRLCHAKRKGWSIHRSESRYQNRNPHFKSLHSWRTISSTLWRFSTYFNRYLKWLLYTHNYESTLSLAWLGFQNGPNSVSRTWLALWMCIPSYKGSLKAKLLNFNSQSSDFPLKLVCQWTLTLLGYLDIGLICMSFNPFVVHQSKSLPTKVTQFLWWFGG
jgi:hypothetical protein